MKNKITKIKGLLTNKKLAVAMINVGMGFYIFKSIVKPKNQIVVNLNFIPKSNIK